MPFSELYDVLRSASREQLLAWARDLERMPRGPRQRAAVTAYYKSLIQVDHRAAIEAVFQAENLNMRDVAIDALLKAAPESIWGDLAEMMVRLPYQGRGAYREDVIWNWSRVDPEAASQFIESHPFSAKKRTEDDRLFSLLCNWPNIDPAAAQRLAGGGCIASDEGCLCARLSRAGAASIARARLITPLRMHTKPKFEGAINELVYQFVRSSER